MNNNNRAAALANLITNIVSDKGTCFAGFTYNGKRRNLTIGANLTNRVRGVGNWGTTLANGSLIEHKGHFYLQGVPNNEETAPTIKRFKLDEVQDFVIG